MRLHEWILHHNAFKFWRSLCKNPSSVNIIDPRDICPDVNLEDIPIRDMESIRVNKYIENYQTTVSKEKRIVTIESSDSSMDLVVHNIVMVMELKQKISQTLDSKVDKTSTENLYEAFTEPNTITLDEINELFGNTETLEQIFDKKNSEGDYQDTLINNWLHTFVSEQQQNNNAIESNGDSYQGWPSVVREIFQKQNKIPDKENVLTTFVDTEERKFVSYLHYMTKSVQDACFIETCKKYNLFSTRKTDQNTNTGSQDNMEVDEDEQSMDFLQEEIDKTLHEMDTMPINISNTETSQWNHSDVNSTNNTPIVSQYDMAYVRREEYMKLPQFRVNLQNIACATIKFGSQFNQRKFASVCCRSHFFQLTVNIYPHGTISSTGSTHEIASILAFQHIISILREVYGPTAFEDPYIKLNNLVLSGYTGYPICINLLTTKFPSYFRKIKGFSGITFINRARTDKITILIFKGGSICVSGGGSIESVIENTKLALSMIKQCKENPENLVQENKLMELAKSQQSIPVTEKPKRQRRNKSKKET